MIAQFETDAAIPAIVRNDTPPILLTEVEFGTLTRDGDCVGFGICRMQAAIRRHAPARRRCHAALAELSMSGQGRLRLFFPRAGLKPCTERAFFHGWLFPVPVAYVIPDVLTSLLGKSSAGIISPGAYPIRRNAKGYWIEF